MKTKPSIKFLRKWESDMGVYYIELYKHSINGYFLFTNTLGQKYYRNIGHRSFDFTLNVIESIRLQHFCMLHDVDYEK